MPHIQNKKQLIDMKARVIERLFSPWVEFLVRGSGSIFLVVAVIMWFVSKLFTDPIIQLTKIIKIQNKLSQKLKEDSSKDRQKRALKLQIDFAGGYKEHNQEMNTLYLNYS
jgi:hypothetical protein